MFNEEIGSNENILKVGVLFSILLLLTILLSGIVSPDCTKIVTILGKDNNAVKTFQAKSRSISISSLNSRVSFQDAQTGDEVHLNDASFTISKNCPSQ